LHHKEKNMAKHGKKYRESAMRYDKETPYGPREALELVKTLAPAKFDETVEAVFKLGIDPKKADQLVRGTVSLPHGTGKDVRVAVFAPADKEKEATEAGADVVGGKELVEKIQAGGELNFDVAIATPDMMAEVGKLGKILGPRGLMPNPKAGTVTAEVGKAVTEFKAGRIEYRNDRYGNVHIPIGRVSFESGRLRENLATVASELLRAKPAAAKGRYLRRVAVSSTMGPGIRVDSSQIEDLVKEFR
jgi:large subunit ribosomal protein L1